MSGSVQDPSSKSRSLKTKRAVFLLYAAFCLTRFSLAAAAQQSTYSAGSVMAALKKGSKISLKGSEITFADAVVESRKSSVLFRSSGNHKVTCELASPIVNGNAKPLIASPLTVVGKVRARGILGNMTLDDCSPAPGAATSDSNSYSVAPVEPIATSAAEQSQEQPEIPVENPFESRDTETITPVADPVSRWKSLSRKVAVPVRKLVAVVIPGERPSGKTTGEPNVTGEAGLTKAALPVAFYVRVAAIAGLALLVLVKLRRAFTPRRLRTPRDKPVSPEIRRAAIEALLSGKKMTWRDRLKFKRA